MDPDQVVQPFLVQPFFIVPVKDGGITLVGEDVGVSKHFVPDLVRIMVGDERNRLEGFLSTSCRRRGRRGCCRRRRHSFYSSRQNRDAAVGLLLTS